SMNTGLPLVAIVGRPNVGKSSLFNRILNKRKAIVYQEAGTTRDRVSQEVEFEGKEFILTDTGGFLSEDVDKLWKSVKLQIKKAIEECDILLFVCDGKAGLLPQDSELAPILRKSGKKIILVVNKIDNEKMNAQVPDFYRLGLGEPYPVSVLHNLGVNKLLTDLTAVLPKAAEREPEIEGIRVAIVGRPNVGKSSFINYLLKEERVIVSDIPGTTRDTVDTYLKSEKGDFILVDTAGLRHKRKLKEAVSVYSMMRAKEAIRRSSVCLVMVDGYDGIRVDDLKIAELVISEGKGCILCINKWDTVDVGPVEYKEMVYSRAASLKKYPVIFVSAKTGYNVYNSLDTIKKVLEGLNTKLSTSQLNRLLDYMKSRGPFRGSSHPLKASYITQVAVSPPTFLIFVNKRKYITESHTNFIENILREDFGFFGTPIRLEFREK
ncbi:MAG: ribosome biogenesis GTPase Der, partial [Candidatus Omnitrophica bacterium]|nr:ribosome biogenesis GTPase Der [Candidatus Omnitrophota bacterium]